MSRFNTTPSVFTDLNDLFPVLNEKVGLTAEQFQKLVENTFYLYEHLGLADVEVGTITTTYAAPGTPFDVNVSHREVLNAEGKMIDYFDYSFTVAVTKLTADLSVERVRSDTLTDMTITVSPLTGDDLNKGYNFHFNAKLPKSGITKEEISDGNEGEVLYVNPNGLPHKKQIMSPNPIVENAADLESAQDSGGTSFADILTNWGRFSHFQGNFDNAIPTDIGGWNIDTNTGSITNSVNSESHIGFYSPDKVLSLSKRVKFIVTDASYSTHLDTLSLVAAYCETDEQTNTASLDAGNSHAHTLSFVRSPGPRGGFSKYAWALIVDLDYGFDTLETASCKAFTLCDGTSFITKKNSAGNLTSWSNGVYVKVVRNNNVFTGYTSEFDDNELIEDATIELDLDAMTITTKDGVVNLNSTLTAQQILILENFKQANHWGYGSSSQPYCLYEQQGSVTSECIYDIENNETYEFNPNTATWTATGVNPIISLGAGRFANSYDKKALYYNDGTNIYKVSNGSEISANKAGSITDANKTSEVQFPNIKAVVDYISANTVKTIKVNSVALTPTNNEVNIEIPTQTMENFEIATSSWTEQSGVTPFTHKASVTATTTIGERTLVELINNNAVNFATYGFSIASVSGQSITLYSIGRPTSAVTLKIGIGG